MIIPCCICFEVVDTYDIIHNGGWVLRSKDKNAVACSACVEEHGYESLAEKAEDIMEIILTKTMYVK